MTRTDLIELARWINSVSGCVSQAEKDDFYHGALKYFQDEFYTLLDCCGVTDDKGKTST